MGGDVRAFTAQVGRGRVEMPDILGDCHEVDDHLLRLPHSADYASVQPRRQRIPLFTSAA